MLISISFYLLTSGEAMFRVKILCRGFGSAEHCKTYDTWLLTLTQNFNVLINQITCTYSRYMYTACNFHKTVIMIFAPVLWACLKLVSFLKISFLGSLLLHKGMLMYMLATFVL